MVRFIFICMGVVAVSLLSIAGQFVFEGINDAQQTVLARNDSAQDTTEVTAVPAGETPELLNEIETAAGTLTYDPNDHFSSGFTNVAPKALQDAAEVLPAAVDEAPQPN